METVARQARTNAGSDVITNGDGTNRIMNISREDSAPRAVGPVFQEVARFPRVKRTDQRTDGLLLEFDLLRRMVKSKM